MKTLLTEWRALLFVLSCVGLSAYIMWEQNERKKPIAECREANIEAIETLAKGALTLENCERVMRVWFNEAQDQNRQVMQCWSAYAKEIRKGEDK